MKTHSTITDFIKDFGTEKQCREHLCDVKWKNGFSCHRCGHEVAVKGRTWYYRRCQRCHFDESCTSNTLFHKVKFPLEKAFLMLYLISTHKKGISTCELARQFGVKQKTAWFFKRKVQEAMQRSGTKLLKGTVEVDETVIGGKEEGKPGRSHGEKKITQVAIETDTDVKGNKIIKRAYSQCVEGYDSTSLKTGLASMAVKGALVVTDKWSGYSSLSSDFIHVDKLSEMGKAFELLHWHIFNLKNWIRGTHHHISNKHAQRYLDEYHFRFNRRNIRSSSTMIALKRMVNHPWMPYREAIAS